MKFRGNKIIFHSLRREKNPSITSCIRIKVQGYMELFRFDFARGQTKLCHDPSQPTTIHNHLPPSKMYPPPTASQNTSTTTHHQSKYIQHYLPFPKKMDHHPTKVKIYSYINSFRHSFNSFFFFEMQYSLPRDFVSFDQFVF